jgi:iron complex transport system ATP-binding protein
MVQGIIEKVAQVHSEAEVQQKKTGHDAAIDAQGITLSCGPTAILKGISLQVKPGEVFGVIGPNGSGKSTLLSVLSGVSKPDSGTVRIDGRDLQAYSRRELACRMAVLQQDSLPPVSFTVREVVEMGRYPFQNWLGHEASDPAERIDAIMKKLEIAQFADRTLEQLSGGERQRVALGKAMAQEPKLLLLDEPTTYLDIGYQIQMMDYVRSWQQESGLTVVAVLHDLNLAAQYCDRILVLKEGLVVQTGTPEQVVKSELIAEVYRTEPTVLPHPVSRQPQILLNPGSWRG